MSKPKQDMENEREDEYLSSEVTKTQKQKEMRGVKPFMGQSSVFLPQDTKG